MTAQTVVERVVTKDMARDSDTSTSDQTPKVPRNGVAKAGQPIGQQQPRKVLTPDAVNPKVVAASYAVRGELYLRAEELRKQGKDIIFTNVGNPQALGAKPVTFLRQVLALVAAPYLLDDPRATESGLFPADAVERARKLLASFGCGGVGAYTDSRGNPKIREEVADFIARRDGVARPNSDHIFLSDGASSAVRLVLSTIIRDKNDAILVPIPQYPLYSASITIFGGTMLSYELNESAGWALDVPALKQQVASARSKGLDVRALVVINPGNPTGQSLTYDNLAELLRFCYEERIVVLADEVYQELTYRSDRPFVSAHKVLKELGEPVASNLEVLSFHSVSKGTFGECGLRGGYVQLDNLDPDTFQQFYKLASINLCPNTTGQVAVSCMVNGPQPGCPSHEQYTSERSDEFKSLKRRAHKVTEAFRSLEGVTCNDTEGAMYAFPQLQLPPKALEAAAAAGKKPDEFYCLRLLEGTGISTVPGSGFGQAEGTAHLRTTILPREQVMDSFCTKIQDFHADFMQQYKDGSKQ